MKKTLTLEIDSELYYLLSRVAEEQGRATEDVVIEWLAQTAPKPRRPMTEAEVVEADRRFRQSCGAGKSGNSRSADNDAIDADLAKEYGSTHSKDD